jgi:hypothetical protein
VVPVEENAQYDMIEAALVHCWVVSLGNPSRTSAQYRTGTHSMSMTDGSAPDWHKVTQTMDYLFLPGSPEAAADGTPFLSL